MKIIQVHNYYQQAGGEDSVVKAELNLLRSNGHEVITFYKSNDEIKGFWQSVNTAIKTFWNWHIYIEFISLIRKVQPHIVHCHNTFPLISPAIYWACAKEKIPVVQTLHNYRLLCPSANLFCKGEIYEHSVGKLFPWQAVKDRVYRDSYAGTLVVSLMLFIHRLIGTWKNKVNAYIVLTSFQKEKFSEGGFEKNKLYVKPNFIESSCFETNKQEFLREKFSNQVDNLYCLYIGRLSSEKGVHIALKAWAEFQKSYKKKYNRFEFCFKIIGDGPQRKELEMMVEQLRVKSSVEFLGFRNKKFIDEIMPHASFLIFPSIWYETFGLTTLEAGLHGIPSIISEPTTTSSIYENNKNALFFKMGNHINLSDILMEAFADNLRTKKIGIRAKEFIKNKYSADKNLKVLSEIYEHVIMNNLKNK